MKVFFTLFILASSMLSSAQIVKVKNNKLERILSFDGKVWRTTMLYGLKNKYLLHVKSEEVNILGMDSTEGLSINDFKAIDNPDIYTHGDTNFASIDYKPVAAAVQNEVAPQKMTIEYFAVKNEDFIRKKVLLYYSKPHTVDRLEVERFIIQEPAKGGGRGQPVFVNNKWFFGLEYPAGYSRHTDGNTPKAYSRHFEKVGNYSYIDLAGRDVEPRAAKGMLRLMHFPGYTKEHDGQYIIVSKTAVIGVAEKEATVQQAFMQYLSTIWKQPRSFLHYNNWFDAKAKDLSGNALLDVYLTYKKNIAPYGVKLDAVVPDNGWQNRKSIWQPLPKYFPKGDTSLALLSRKLKDAGVGLGLWLSLNGYTNNIDWGKENGFREAEPNNYFKQFGRYYSLSATRYKNYMLKRLPQLAKNAHLVYFKHDFNELSDIGEGNNHPPDDRHGNEANVDAAIELLQATTKAVPGILQNMTNWVWFSPWWLQHVDYLWMLAGDDGMNGNWPEISTQARMTTDRDTYIWRMWGDTADRPLVPISRLMTHGIIRRNIAEEETLQDWLEYVLMYYGRGTLLKEWYITPSDMSADEWKGLCLTNNWAKQHQKELNNTVFVGGRPDEGNVYGYIGWEGNRAILVARNPNVMPQTLKISFDKINGYMGKAGKAFKAKVVFPYVATYPETFYSGNEISVKIPGYATMAFELSKGISHEHPMALSSVSFKNKIQDAVLNSVVSIPADVQGRCDLLLIADTLLPNVAVNGATLKAKRSAVSSLNDFAGYAKSGMHSDKAAPWKMSSYDLKDYAGKKVQISYNRMKGFKAYLLLERKVNDKKVKTNKHRLWPVNNATRRQITEIL